MKYIIDEDLCKQKGLSTEELLLILLIQGKVDINKTLANMSTKQIIVPDMFNPSTYLVTQRWSNTATDILLSADTSIPKVKDLEGLATEMAKLFPSGLKPNTNVYWKGNRKDTVQKLQKFFKLYGQYTFEDILEATKYYVEKYKNNHTTMRVLKYFIMKDNESDLATTLENMHQDGDTQTEIDWETELR